jgi:hypothetical protein
MDIFLLGEEGTLIVPSQRLFSSIKRCLKDTGMSIKRGIGPKLIVNSDLSSAALELAAEALAEFILAFR